MIILLVISVGLDLYMFVKDLNTSAKLVKSNKEYLNYNTATNSSFASDLMCVGLLLVSPTKTNTPK